MAGRHVLGTGWLRGFSAPKHTGSDHPTGPRAPNEGHAVSSAPVTVLWGFKPLSLHGRPGLTWFCIR